MVVVALLFSGDGQGLSADTDEASAKRFERQLLQQVAVGGAIAAEHLLAVHRFPIGYGAHSQVLRAMGRTLQEESLEDTAHTPLGFDQGCVQQMRE